MPATQVAGYAFFVDESALGLGSMAALRRDTIHASHPLLNAHDLRPDRGKQIWGTWRMVLSALKIRPVLHMSRQVMGLLDKSEQAELASTLMSLANAYLQELSGDAGIFDAMVESLRPKIDALARAVREAKGTKGLMKAKREAMSYIWRRLTANPSTSFREGSPAKLAHDRFMAHLDTLVPS